MRAAFYEKNGPANEVLSVATMADPVAGPGEVRIKLSTSGVNPSDDRRSVCLQIKLTRMSAYKSRRSN